MTRKIGIMMRIVGRIDDIRSGVGFWEKAYKGACITTHRLSESASFRLSIALVSDND